MLFNLFTLFSNCIFCGQIFFLSCEPGVIPCRYTGPDHYFFFKLLGFPVSFCVALHRLLRVFLHQSCVKSMEAVSLSRRQAFWPCSRVETAPQLASIASCDCAKCGVVLRKRFI